jgi:hypothetical protein
MMQKAVNGLSTLIVGNRDGLSLGRLMLITVFGICIWHWVKGIPLDDRLFYSFELLTGYVFGSKVAANLISHKYSEQKQ